MNRRFLACVLAVCMLVAASSAPLAGSVAATVPLLSGADSKAPAPFGQVSRTGGHIVATEGVHDRGITGSGVAVGVVGTAFEPEGSAVADNVAGHRRAPDERATGEVVVGPDDHVDSRHDTAVAAVVTETAPDADLYLAAVGDNPTPTEYQRAIDWLTANDVEVVVDAGSYFASNPRTNERLTAVAERAAANGTVFVTSAGNYANSQWVGAGTADGWVDFSNATEANRLADSEITGGDVSLRLSWNSSADYDLYLYRERANGPDPVVAKSVRRQAGSNSSASSTNSANSTTSENVTNSTNATNATSSTDAAASWESIDATVPRGNYYVAIDARDGDNESRLRLLSSRQSLEHAASRDSVVAPATGTGVVAVGAVDTDTGEIARYSSRSGSLVDVWGPATVRTQSGTLEGTSAAAPYVAGTMALVASTCERDVPSDELVKLLRASAVGDDRYTPESVGIVEAAEAVETAERTAGNESSSGCYPGN